MVTILLLFNFKALSMFLRLIHSFNIHHIIKFQVNLPNLCYISLQNNNLQYLPNIPFHAEPTILIRNNDLTYLSYSFARYLKRKHVPPIEELSDWNFHSAR